ncbi:MAG: tRNA (adenosine(37)-N6)-dimethylallyltransferase MiaA [Anaerolineae bacterium]
MRMGRRTRPVIAIVGPTAVGKTALSLEMAEALGGEIVSADSRQIYRFMDIGTDKPSPEDRRRVPHHLIDIVDPDQPLTLAQYQRMARDAIADIHQRGRVPLLVGGTGLYVRAVLEGLQIPEVPPDPELRARLEEEAREYGADHLHSRLRSLDPEAASRIDPRNVRRVIRALEVCLRTGRPISQQQRASSPGYDVLRIGLTRPRRELYARIDARVDAMIAAGLVDEVRALVDRGYDLSLPAMTGVGYRQIARYLAGQCSLEEAIREIKRRTRRFVRQQNTWFRPDDPAIRWYNLSQTTHEQIIADARRWLCGETL